MARQQQRLKLAEETWGDRLHRAYRRCRATTGLTYEDHSAAISEILPVSDQTLMRLEGYDEIPRRPIQRQWAYLIALAYGYEPADFGLNEENVALAGVDVVKVRRLLDPNNRRKSGRVSRPRTETDNPARGGRRRISAGLAA